MLEFEKGLETKENAVVGALVVKGRIVDFLTDAKMVMLNSYSKVIMTKTAPDLKQYAAVKSPMWCQVYQ